MQTSGLSPHFDINEIPSFIEEKKTFVNANWDTESVSMLCGPSKRINHSSYNRMF